MADGAQESSWGGYFGDLIKGGLSTALDIEAEKQRRKLDEQSIAAETPKYVRSQDDVTVREGTSSWAALGLTPLWIGLGLAAVLGVVLIAVRR